MEIKWSQEALKDMEKFGWTKVTGWSLRDIYWRLVPYDWRPSQIWYRFKCWAWHRYTTVHPRTLPWHTFTDRDKVLLHCCFEILSQFVEREMPADSKKDHQDEPWAGQDRAVRELYRWWKEDFPTLDDANTREADEEVKRKLHQLIDIYDHLWT